MLTCNYLLSSQIHFSLRIFSPIEKLSNCYWTGSLFKNNSTHCSSGGICLFTYQCSMTVSSSSILSVVPLTSELDVGKLCFCWDEVVYCVEQVWTFLQFPFLNFFTTTDAPTTFQIIIFKPQNKLLILDLMIYNIMIFVPFFVSNLNLSTFNPRGGDQSFYPPKN